MKVSLASSLDDVPAAAWDRLAAVAEAGFYLSHRWLRHEEDSVTATAGYVLVTDEASRLVGAAPVYLVHQEPNAGYRPDQVLTGVRPADRLLIAGARRGYRNAPLLHPDLDTAAREDCLRLLVDAVAQVAREWEADQAWWLYVHDDVAAALATATGARVPQLQGTDAAVSLPGNGFDDYLGAFPARRQYAIRKELSSFGAAAYDLRRLKLSQCWSQAGDLLAQLQGKYGHPAEPEPLRQLLRRQADGLADSGTVLGCFRDDRMVGFALTYDFAGTVWLRATGFDYDRLAGAAEYFALSCYQPIEHAYRSSNLRRMHLGKGTAQAKSRRGARLSPLWAVPNDPSHAADDDVVVAANHRLAETWRAELGDHAPSLPFN
ncbi:peptidogalycan biosysnthesis protein [Streptacidiphilus anmyonensis]|uniref:peptidogalycan biosysnthesis protein n=1 Tax=Streptacidiphilus anmyonensis TaxID=405782 RepID=UPI0006932869|nr:peptidogalycan biosysnthesis protein [Streptacidiphilus anmyonensis]